MDYTKVDETVLRFRLGAKLMSLKYGRSISLPREAVQKAWRPTGDHDRSIEGAFHALALMNGGHRPETSYTTDERIENDLDGSFTWSQEPLSGDYVFHRKDSACPKCKGRMQIQTRSLDADRAPIFEDFDALKAVCEITVEPCDLHG